MENTKQEFVYGACMRNYAAKLGGHTTDGCREFLSAEGGFHCAACGCHKNFHNKTAVEGYSGTGGSGCSINTVKVKAEVVEVSDDSEEEKQLHLVAAEIGQQQQQQYQPGVVEQMSGALRRRRTRFTDEQRQWMHAFAASLGWRMRRERWDETNRFCEQIGVPRHVFKTWLNNNKLR